MRVSTLHGVEKKDGRPFRGGLKPDITSAAAGAAAAAGRKRTKHSGLIEVIRLIVRVAFFFFFPSSFGGWGSFWSKTFCDLLTGSAPQESMELPVSMTTLRVYFVLGLNARKMLEWLARTKRL